VKDPKNIIPKEVEAELGRLDRLIDHARGIYDDPNHRNELPPVVEQCAEKLPQWENDRQKLWAGLTTEDRMLLRADILRRIEEQFSISTEPQSEREEALREARRLRNS
jgi:hypothetical protein